MRGTLRITWLLLSLSICSESSDVTSPSPTTAASLTKGATPVAAVTTQKATISLHTTKPPTPTTKATSVITTGAVATTVTTTQQPTTAVPQTSLTTSKTMTIANPTMPITIAAITTKLTSTSGSVTTQTTTITNGTVTNTTAMSEVTASPVNSKTDPNKVNRDSTTSTKEPATMVTEKKTMNTDAMTAAPSVGPTAKNKESTWTTGKDHSTAGTTAATISKSLLTSPRSTKLSVTTERLSTPGQTPIVQVPHVTNKPLPTNPTTMAGMKVFEYSSNEIPSEKPPGYVKLCKSFMPDSMNGTCTFKLNDGEIDYSSLSIKVDPNQVREKHSEILRQEDKAKKPTDNKILIAILASCGALLIMIVILGVCVSYRRKPYQENQQHLTEELHTVENGYHDNPTLEVMEVQPEMQEKKMALNGEFSDSWIVPIDNLLKEEMPDEEDTHL